MIHRKSYRRGIILPLVYDLERVSAADKTPSHLPRGFYIPVTLFRFEEKQFQEESLPPSR